jgi:hypothetical protein
MANPKAMYEAQVKEFGLSREDGVYAEVASACIIACAMKECKDEIVQALDRLTNEIKGGLE